MVEERPRALPGETGEPLQVLRAAAERAAADLEELADRARPRNPEGAEVLEAQALMLRDPGIEEEVERAVGAGTPLPDAITTAFAAYAEQVEALGDEYLAARAADVREVSRLLLRTLAGGATSRLAGLPGPRIVVAGELSPVDTLSADPGLLRGIVTETGGRTSHAAIVARELGIPAVMGVPGAVAAARSALGAQVDGDAGTVRFTAEIGADDQALATARLHLEDVFVRLMANAGSPAAAQSAAERGALGIGLLRTELLFLGRASPVDEAEQERVYAAACDAMAPHPVVVRTVDAGSDKPLPYLPSDAPEPNPALGRRGIRLWLAHPELAAAQARALLRASADRPNLRVMFPMVAAPAEVRSAKALFDAEAAALGVGLPHLGMMLETPAAATGLAAYAGLIDFVSLGTNDLAQYALGADRELAWGAELSEWNPGVLRLIEHAAAAAAGLGIELGACGEMAGTVEGAVFLAGLGAGSLSMAVASLEPVSGVLRGLGRDGCAEATRAALAARSAQEALDRIRARIAQAGPSSA